MQHGIGKEVFCYAHQQMIQRFRHILYIPCIFMEHIRSLRKQNETFSENNIPQTFLEAKGQ